MEVKAATTPQLLLGRDQEPADLYTLIDEIEERGSAAGPVHVSGDLGLLTFNVGMPEQTPAVSGVDVAQVRDGRIAVLHTFLTAEG